MATNQQAPAIDLPPIALEARDLHEEWLAERRTFVGGSEIYELLNEPQYGKGCVRALAYRKLNTPPDYPEQLDEALMKRGHILEPVAAAMYEEQTGRKLRRAPSENGMPKVRRHPDYPWAGVHVDRIVLAGYADVTETGSAEIKSRGEGPFLRVKSKGLFPGDLLQIQHAMFVNNHSWGPFITIGLFGGMPLEAFDLKRDEGAIDTIKRAGESFASIVWGRGELPARPFDGSDDRCKVCAFRMECRGEELDKAMAAAMKAEKAGKKALVQITNTELSQALADRDLVKKEEKAIAEMIDVVDAKIHQLLTKEDGTVIDAAFVPDYGKVYWGEQPGRTTAKLGELMQYLRDLSKPAAELAEVVEKFVASVDWNGADAPPMWGQAISVLRNLADAPDVISKEYTSVGKSFRSLRLYPNKAV